MSKKTFRLENGTEVTAGVNIYKAYASKRNKERYMKRKRDEYVAKSLDDERSYDIADKFDIEAEVERRLRNEKVRVAINRLPKEERNLIVDYFFNDMSLRSLAKKYSVSHMTIHNTINKILEKIKSDIIDNFM